MRLNAKILVAFIGLAIGITLIGSLAPYTNRASYVITVDTKEVYHTEADDYYLIFTDDGRAFKLDDLFWVGQFNSSSMYAQLKAGGTYHIEAIGWRIPFLSSYPTICKILTL